MQAGIRALDRAGNVNPSTKAPFVSQIGMSFKLYHDLCTAGRGEVKMLLFNKFLFGICKSK